MNHRWAARAVVVALHAALLAALWLHRPARLGDVGARQATTVQLILPRRQAPPPEAVREPSPARAPAPTVIEPQPFSIEVPAAPDERPPTTAAPTPAPTTPAEPPRTTLRLTLPPGAAASSSVRSAALNDPRSNTRRQTFEDRIANAAAVTGDWVEERTGDGRMRRRRGDTCVETEESRIAMIDRFNENVAPRAARMTGKPYKCPP